MKNTNSIDDPALKISITLLIFLWLTLYFIILKEIAWKFLLCYYINFEIDFIS